MLSRMSSPGKRIPVFICLGLLAVGTVARVQADDWPEWRGKGRLGVWNETGILEQFPDNGLEIRWRTPINRGYSGPAVSGGRVFVTDARQIEGTRVTERLLALDEVTGRVLWTHEWESNYRGLELTFAIGPRATPTVDGDRVYALGTKGRLVAADTATGRVLWEKDFNRDYSAAIPTWGTVSAPLVDGDQLICLVGGEPDGKVMAFDKRTGEELWRALSSDWETGYNPPLIVDVGGDRQLIIWHPRAISSLDPTTGAVYWEVPFEVDMGITVATPVLSGPIMYVSTLYNSAMAVELDKTKPGATMLWRGDNEALHAMNSTPVIQGDYVYGFGHNGVLGCWELATGRRVWTSRELVRQRSPGGTAFFVRNGDRYFINNGVGELVIARLSPDGFHEISRTTLIEPTHPNSRNPDGAVHWSHPAYANKHIFVRNDQEILSASLAKD